jgi:hypothetical protein
MYRPSKDDEDGDEGTEGRDERVNTSDGVAGMCLYMCLCTYIVYLCVCLYIYKHMHCIYVYIFKHGRIYTYIYTLVYA